MAAASVAASITPSAVAEVNRDILRVSLVLRYQGQLSLAWLVLTIRAAVVPRESGDALWVLINDGDEVAGEGDPALFGEFRRSIHLQFRNLPLLQRAGYDEHVVSHIFRLEMLRAAQRAAGLIPPAGADYDDETAQPYRNGGFGAVPASAAAVRSLEKQTFSAAAGGNGDAITKCGICLDEFVDGEQVNVMPCPCREQRFHTDCIAKWLEVSNMCPLCRHELPTAECI